MKYFVLKSKFTFWYFINRYWIVGLDWRFGWYIVKKLFIKIHTSQKSVLLKNPCISSTNLSKNVHLKIFWIQFITVHFQGLCSLCLCLLRPYYTLKWIGFFLNASKPNERFFFSFFLGGGTLNVYVITWGCYPKCLPSSSEGGTEGGQRLGLPSRIIRWQIEGGILWKARCKPMGKEGRKMI